MNDPTIGLVQEDQYNPNLNRAFNQLTSTLYDTCTMENQLRVGSKPMKYYVNQFNSPQSNPFMEFTTIGNQQVYNVQNSYQTPLPTRLNPIYQSYVFPYSTSPFLGQQSPAREYADTDSNLRFGTNLRDKKSSVVLSEVDFNRWDFVAPETVQNAGNFGGAFQSNGQGMNRDGIGRDGYYDYKAQNNVLFANSAWPYFGISSRNELHNQIDINRC